MRQRALAIVSHDLRNPLSAILMGAFALRQEAGLSVEAHGGSIEVSSTLAEGTRFVVRLPKK